MSTAVENFPALVLNADFRPLSYFPLSLWSWQNSIKAVFLSRVNVVSEYDRAIHSPSTEIKLQSNELDDARWFDRYELRNPGAAMRLPRPTSISRRLLDDWLEGA